MFRKSTYAIVFLAAASAVSTPSYAGVIISTDFNSGFSSGSGFPRFEDGWGQPDGDDSIALDAGPSGVGDHAAFVQLNGGDDRLHFMTGNILNNFDSSSTSPYDDDYTALGVDSISFDFRHGGAGSDLSLRVHLWDADNNLRAVTSSVFDVTIADTFWQTVTFSLDEADLVPFGGGSISGILDNVTGLSIRNTPVTTGGPGSAPELDSATSYYFDNISLSSTASIPAPTAAWLILSGLIGLLLTNRNSFTVPLQDA